MLFTHLDVYESYQILQGYQKNPIQELSGWAEAAHDECKNFFRQFFSQETIAVFNRLKRKGGYKDQSCAQKISLAFFVRIDIF